MNKVMSNYKFDGLYNFRDIGGLSTSEGRKMKSGLLFRSDELSKISKHDIEHFKQLNIKSICDLRTTNEIKSKPTRIKQEDKIEIYNISIYDKSQEFTPLQFFKFLVGNSDSINFEKIISDLYQSLAFKSGAEIKKVISLILDKENLPLIIHCTGGKDRTGYISAIIQLLVGVPYNEVLDHYLISNDLIKPRMIKVERFIKLMSLYRVSSERLKPLLEVRKEYIDSVFKIIEKEHGSFENYLSDVCKIDSEDIKNIKEIILE